MNRELKRVATVVCCMFVALFAAATLTQYVNADSLAANPRNQRTLYESYSVQRGPILVNGTPIASSQPSKDQFKFIRTYANGPLYAPLTGYIPVSGTATGLESAENSMLSGTASNQFLARLNRLVSGQNPVGASVELTIDPTVQQAAWDALGNYTGSVVILEPSTGKVLAMVSKPSYNPNQLTVHDTAAANTAYETLLKDPGQPLINRAMNGNLDPPGSSFKVVVATAALESGKYQPDSSLPNPGSYVLPGTSTTIYNDSHGACGGGDTVTLANALRWSCNIPFAELGIALGDQVLRAQAEKFGFNSQFSIPMTSTASVFPPTRDAAELGLASFGQGNVRVSPLQEAMISAAVANDGIVMNPTVVSRVTGADLAPLSTFQPSPFGRAMSANTAAKLRQMMIDNVQEGAAYGARIDGVAVAGKTGTAQNGPGQPWTLWFTGFAPANQPKYALGVLIQNDGGQTNVDSGLIAAPVAKKVLEAVLKQ